MPQTVENIIVHARPLASVSNQSKMAEVLSKMVSENISMVPVISGTKVFGTIRQKDLFDWSLKHKL